jgi:heme exporter protein CcmD
MEAATHTGFIVTAYAFAFGVIGGLTAWVLADYRAQLRKLAELEKRGVARRSAAPAGTIEKAKANP